MATLPITLAFRRVFGINGLIPDNISYADEDLLVYVAGHALVLYSPSDKKQRFINFNISEIADVITAFTSCTGKR
jgi:hypothetical protein